MSILYWQLASTSTSKSTNTNAATGGSTKTQKPIQSLFRLSIPNSEELLQCIKEASPYWHVSYPQFQQAVYKYLGRPPHEDPHATAIQGLFKSLNKSNTSHLTLKDVLDGVFVLSGGDAVLDSTVHDTFQVWDVLKQNYLDSKSLLQFLHQVFSVLDRKAPHVFDDNAATPTDLSSMITARCLKEADLVGNGKITFEEFRRWYSHPHQQQLARVIENHYTATLDSSSTPAPLPRPDWFCIDEIARITGISQLSIHDVASAFIKQSSSNLRITTAQFKHILQSFAILLQFS